MITIAVTPAAALAPLPRLLGQLGDCFQVRFAADPGESSPAAGRIVLAPPDQLAALVAGPAAGPEPTLVVTAPARGMPRWTGRVAYADAGGVPAVFRGREVAAQEGQAPAAVPALAGFREIATAGGRPVWATRVSAGPSFSISGFPLPVLADGDYLQDHLNGKSFAALLPVFDFVRRIARGDPPPDIPLRACLIVDDPNLHWPSYGWVDYARLVSFQRECPSHFAMAMVPLDGWRIDRRAARLFREHPQALSLLVHGAMHGSNEFAGDRRPAALGRLLAYASARVRAAETAAGVSIARILAPPHGAIREDALRPLLAFGFEGVTTNRWTLWQHNSRQSRPAGLGLGPADILGGGMPVINRFRLNAPTAPGEILVAAYLGQPIVPYGHHRDFADGMSAIRRTVETINSLGPVDWMDAGRLFATNVRAEFRGNRGAIQLHSRRGRLRLPAAVDEIQVAAPGFAPETVGALRIRSLPPLPDPPVDLRAGLGAAVAVPAGSALEISLEAPPSPGESPCVPLRVPLRLALRRILSEARDRLRI